MPLRSDAIPQPGPPSRWTVKAQHPVSLAGFVMPQGTEEEREPIAERNEKGRKKGKDGRPCMPSSLFSPSFVSFGYNRFSAAGEARTRHFPPCASSMIDVLRTRARYPVAGGPDHESRGTGHRLMIPLLHRHHTPTMAFEASVNADETPLDYSPGELFGELP